VTKLARILNPIPLIVGDSCRSLPACFLKKPPRYVKTSQHPRTNPRKIRSSICSSDSKRSDNKNMFSPQSRTAIACKLATAMTLLLHSMLGCGLVHGCCVEHDVLHPCPVASNPSCDHHATEACHEASAESTPDAAQASHGCQAARNPESCGHGDPLAGVRSATSPERSSVAQPSAAVQTCCSRPAPDSPETPQGCSILHCSFMKTNAKSLGMEFRRLFFSEHFASCEHAANKRQSPGRVNQQTMPCAVKPASLCALQCSWQI